jgi:hypothetical protein
MKGSLSFLMATVFLVSVGQGMSAEPILVPDGFLTGNAWRDMSTIGQTNYAMGVVDGFLFASAAERAGTSLKWVHECIFGIKSDQLRSMVHKEVEASPGEWNQSTMHVTVYRALLNDCPNSPKPR